MCSDVAVSIEGLINMELLSAPVVVGDGLFHVSLRSWNVEDNNLFVHPVEVPFRPKPLTLVLKIHLLN